jgi:hypothetical protein
MFLCYRGVTAWPICLVARSGVEFVLDEAGGPPPAGARRMPGGDT